MPRRSRRQPWSPLRPLEGEPLPPFPVHCLPGRLQRWVSEHAESVQVPVDLPAMLALSAVATCAAKRYVVRIKPEWLEPLNIFTLVALPSGTRKSVIFDAATAPLQAAQLELLEQQDAVSGFEEMAAIEDVEELHLRLVVDAQPVAAQARTVTSLGAAPTKSTGPNSDARIFVTDVTPERIAELVACNRGRLAIFTDEGEIAEILKGRYGGSVEVFLRSHSGQSILIERKTKKPVHVRNPALTLGLAVQPDVLRGLASKRAVRERGLLGRFLIAVPDAKLGFRKVETTPVAAETISTYASNIRGMLDATSEVDARGEIVPDELFLDEEAWRIFRTFCEEVEGMLRPEAIFGESTGAGGKLTGAVARLAALLWIAEHASAPVPERISVRTVEAAIEIGRYLVPHSVAAFNMANPSPVVDGARAVLKMLRRWQAPKVTRREIHQCMKGRFPRAEDLEAPLKVLEAHGYLRLAAAARRPGPGRPKGSYEIHPDVVSKCSKLAFGSDPLVKPAR